MTQKGRKREKHGNLEKNQGKLRNCAKNAIKPGQRKKQLTVSILDPIVSIGAGGKVLGVSRNQKGETKR